MSSLFVRAVVASTSFVFGLSTLALGAWPSAPVKYRRPVTVSAPINRPVTRPIFPRPPVVIPPPKPIPYPIPKPPIPHPIPKPPVPKPPLPPFPQPPKPPVPQPPVPNPPLPPSPQPPRPPKHGYCWPHWHPGCSKWPSPPVVINPPPVIIEPPPVIEPPVVEPPSPDRPESFNLVCSPASEDLQDIASLNVTVTPLGDGGLSLNGIVGFTDSQRPPQSFSSEATGMFRDTEINLRLENVGSIYLMPLQDQNGATYFQGDIDLFGSRDENHLDCVVNKLP